jgi:hypothetical protein
MSLKALLTGTHLDQWADELPARGLLPRLVRRLVLAITDPIEEIAFAADEGIGRPGYDGVVRTSVGNSFVPTGWSGWETGVNTDPRQKANEDYDARTTAPSPLDPRQSTFVFVTPRRWTLKGRWVSEKQAEGKWAGVRVYDADDLEQWLERAPAVAAWACRLIHRLPEGVRDLDEVWEGWVARTLPPLAPGVLLAGRGEAAETLRKWLTNPPSVMSIRGNSVDEAIGVFAAVAERLPDSERERLRSRAVVVDTPDTWREVSGIRTPLVLVAPDPVASAASQAVGRGHHVFVASGAETAAGKAIIDLPPLARGELERAIVAMGVPEGRAKEIASESKGVVAVVTDLLGAGATANTPRWADPAHGPHLVPLLLAGSWSESEADREAVRSLARVSPDDFDRLLIRWANAVDPPVRRVGEVWEWIARRRAWTHLARFVTSADLDAFRRISMRVLGEGDPRFDMPPEDRWAAAVHGRLPRYSDRLRDGLVDGLALLATGADLLHAGMGADSAVHGVVQALFGDSPDPRRWYALAGVLRPLAEAAPDAFLAAVERDVLGSPDVMATLFRDERPFGGGGRHIHLLWALEALAWSPDYLSRVTVILAELTARDPGGSTGNRPSNSLRTIFRPWLPHTNAPVAARYAAIDAAARVEEGVAFELCLSLLPVEFDVTTPTARPRWRPWRNQPPARARPEERADAIRMALDRLLRWARVDPARWARLLGALPNCDPGQAEEIVIGCERAVTGGMGSTEPLRNAVRGVLHRARSRPDSTGVAPESLTRLEGVLRSLEPASLVARHAWLFDHHPNLPVAFGDDFDAQDAIASAREGAVREVVEASDVDGIVQLAERAKDPFSLGVVVARSGLTDPQIILLSERGLDADPGPLRACTNGLITAQFRAGGWAWADRLFAGGPPALWGTERRARFARALPFESSTWDRVERWGEAVAAAYWAAVIPVAVPDVPRDGVRALRTLLDRGRPFAALDLAPRCLPRRNGRPGVPAALLVEVMRAASDPAAPDRPRPEAMSGYDVESVLDAIEAAGEIDDASLARLEWYWLPLLEHSLRGWRTLHRALSRDPSFFASMVSLIYRAGGERGPESGAEGTTDPDPQTRLLAERSWRVLHDWTVVPGTQSDGSLDSIAMTSWVRAARAACRAADRVDVGDSEIGQVLAHAPVGADGIWPHEAVRAVVEGVRSVELERGLLVGLLNSRGVTSRSLDTGGEPEQALAERYHAFAAALAPTAPRTAGILREIGRSYERDARREDDRRDLAEYE